MDQPAQNKKLLKLFEKNIKSEGLSDITAKNYLSDLHHFIKWSAKNDLKISSKQAYSEYRTHLITKDTPTTTINRYLSSLRSFADFLHQKGLVPYDPAEDLRNTETKEKKMEKRDYSETVNEFKKALQKEELSKTTIKNYLSDVRQFLEFAGEK